jgi:hypothetical protein
MLFLMMSLDEKLMVMFASKSVVFNNLIRANVVAPMMLFLMMSLDETL